MNSSLRSRGIVNFLQEPGTFMHVEHRAGQTRAFLEPGSIQVRVQYAREAIRTGWLVPRDYDLFSRPMSWVYQRQTEIPRA